MTHQQLDYAARIREEGYRMTPQREMVLDAVCEGHGHTTVEEINARVHAKAPAVNRSTVYRTLEFLKERRLIVTANIGGRTVYEIAHRDPHHHLVCRQCGREVEISQTLLGSAFDAIEKEFDFRVAADHLVLEGLCQACRQAK